MGSVLNIFSTDKKLQAIAENKYNRRKTQVQ